MSRPGKIARLPRTVRDTLNVRLEDGQQGPELLAWLNAEPAVQAVLAAHFNGQPINAQNLSDWRCGGYAAWLEQERVLTLAERLHERKPEVDEVISEEELAASLTQSAMLLLAREMHVTWAMEEGSERARVSLALINALLRLRRQERDRSRAQRERAEADRAAREVIEREDVQKAPPPAAPVRRPAPAPANEAVSAEDDRKIAAVWASAMKLAKGTPSASLAKAVPFGPKLPAALQAA